ncbi:hypothetical protein [Pseudomonas sp.]|uniref:hypothetical protein n=1 Tax=Pseudomonas sp. TaxID=306 RepID=UPI00272F4848|nr:hypothetical protein [Pseudomonas sp.]MDP2244656.1 hypothetical protein [Pseudomonas sp.]
MASEFMGGLYYRVIAGHFKRNKDMSSEKLGDCPVARSTICRKITELDQTPGRFCVVRQTHLQNQRPCSAAEPKHGPQASTSDKGSSPLNRPLPPASRSGSARLNLPAQIQIT